MFPSFSSLLHCFSSPLIDSLCRSASFTLPSYATNWALSQDSNSCFGMLQLLLGFHLCVFPSLSSASFASVFRPNLSTLLKHCGLWNFFQLLNRRFYWNLVKIVHPTCRICWRIRNLWFTSSMPAVTCCYRLRMGSEILVMQCCWGIVTSTTSCLGN